MGEPELKLADKLALDRTRMAVERTLMAWVRTSLSMISFGFSIYKFVELLQQDIAPGSLRPQAPRNVGLTLIGIGTFALVVASVQYRQQMKRLSADGLFSRWDLTFVVACLLSLLGLLMFGSIILHSGAFA
jgi:putative membrane protein